MLSTQLPTRHHRFIGRDEVLDRIRTHFENPESTPGLALVGPPGSGKTRTAIELCHQTRDLFPKGIFWVTATSVDAVDAALAELAGEMGWLPDGVFQLTEAAEHACGELSEEGGWLLVLDSVSNWESIREAVPEPCPGRILVTTRSTQPLPEVDRIELPELSEDVAQLLLAGSSDSTEGERLACAALARELDSQPLLLELAGALVSRDRGTHSGSSEDALKELHERVLQTVDDHQSNDPRPDKAPPGRDDERRVQARIEALCRLSLEALAEESPRAVEFLYAAALLAPRHRVPLDVLPHRDKANPSLFGRLRALSRFVLQGEDEESPAPETLAASLARLALASWEPASESLSLQEPIQRALLELLRKDPRSSVVFQETYRAVGRSFFTALASGEGFELSQSLVPHLLSVAASWKLTAGDSEASRELIAMAFRLSRFLMDNDRFGDMKTLNTVLLALCQETCGAEHVDTLGAANNLAIAQNFLGDLENARESFTRCLELSEKILGPEHPDTVGTLGNLAHTLKRLGETAASIELWGQILEIRQRTLGVDDPQSRATLKTLLDLTMQSQDFARARQLLEERLEFLRPSRSPDDPEILQTLGGLAVALDGLGLHTESTRFHREALELSRRIHGPSHSTTVWILHNYLCHQDDSQGADDELRGQLLQEAAKLPPDDVVGQIALMRWGAETQAQS